MTYGGNRGKVSGSPRVDICGSQWNIVRWIIMQFGEDIHGLDAHLRFPYFPSSAIIVCGEQLQPRRAASRFTSSVKTKWTMGLRATDKVEKWKCVAFGTSWLLFSWDLLMWECIKYIASLILYWWDIWLIHLWHYKNSSLVWPVMNNTKEDTIVFNILRACCYICTLFDCNHVKGWGSLTHTPTYFTLQHDFLPWQWGWQDVKKKRTKTRE